MLPSRTEAPEARSTRRPSGGWRRGCGRSRLLLLLAGGLAFASPGPGAPSGDRAPAIEIPAGWDQAGISTEGYELGLDSSGGRGGSSCLRIRGRRGARGFLGAMQSLEAWPFRGRRLRLAAWVRTDGVNQAGLFLRIYDRDRRRLAFDNMRSRPIRGSGDWALHQVVLDVPEDAAEVAFGAFLHGQGSVWADDFSLTVVGPEVPVTATGPGPPSVPAERLFETDYAPAAPGSAWLLGGTAPDDYEVELEPTGGRDGSAAAVLRSTAERPAGFVALFQGIDPREHRGRRLRLSAWVETEAVTGRAGLWMRVDGPGYRQILAFDNMKPRPIRGTGGWRRYEIVLYVSTDARRIYYGALLNGPGRIRVDDFQLEPVGPDEPVTDLLAPGSSSPVNLDFDHPPTVLEADAPDGEGRR